MDRRTFLTGAAAAAGIGALGARPASALGAKPDPVNVALPSLGLTTKAPRTPVEHLVVVMMENRSVDHFLGWYGKENPSFDGIQKAVYTDLRKGPHGPKISTQDWGSSGRGDFHGRAFHDPNHGWDGGRYERNGGELDGWLDPRTHNDELTLATYEAHDLPTWAQLTRGWQAYDRWHCAVLGPTQPNRYYLYSGTAMGIKDNDLPPERFQGHASWLVGWDWPTVWDQCSAGGVSSAYYFSNLPETAFWGARQLGVTHHVAEFFLQCALGTLPQVSIIDPWFTAPEGLANDDHPLADIRLGETFLSDIVEAFTTSPLYSKSALVITYDEWGGFWDHVNPPRVPDDRATPQDPGGKDDFGQLGFRIPSTIISPWTRGHKVDHTTYNHASILRFVADNWGLPPLTKRTAMSNSIETAFRGFRSFDPEAPFTPYRIPLDVQLQTILDANLGTLQAGKLPRVIPSSLRTGLSGGGVVDPRVPKDAKGSDIYQLAETGWFDHLGFDIDHRFEDGFLRPSDIKGLIPTKRQLRELASQRRAAAALSAR
jgi:phospholipase C